MPDKLKESVQCLEPPPFSSLVALARVALPAKLLGNGRSQGEPKEATASSNTCHYIRKPWVHFALSKPKGTCLVSSGNPHFFRAGSSPPVFMEVSQHAGPLLVGTVFKLKPPGHQLRASLFPETLFAPTALHPVERRTKQKTKTWKHMTKLSHGQTPMNLTPLTRMDSTECRATLSSVKATLRLGAVDFLSAWVRVHIQ